MSEAIDRQEIPMGASDAVMKYFDGMKEGKKEE